MATQPSRSSYRGDLANFNDPIDSVDAGAHVFLSKWHKSFYLGALAITGVLMVPGIVLSIYSFKQGLDPQGPIIIAILPLLIPALVVLIVRARMQEVFFGQLAASWGFDYSSSEPLATTSGFLFSVGSSQGVPTRVLSGKYQDLPLRIFKYSFTTGSGKEQSDHLYTVCELTIPGQGTELLLKGKGILGEVSKPSGTQELHVEDAFNKTFKVFTVPGKEIEALQVLEPDVMEKLIKNYSLYGIEWSNNRINLFSHLSPTTKEDYLELRTKAEELFSFLVPEIAGVVRGEGATAAPVSVPAQGL